MTKANEILNALEKVGKATAINFQPWFRKTSNSVKYSSRYANILLNKLAKIEAIKRLSVYPMMDNERLKIVKIFYSLKGSKFDKLARRELEHTSGIADILLAFLYLYPDYDFEIIHEPNFSISKKENYKPDVHIRMFAYNKVYDFLLEFERTRSKSDIMKKIQSKCEKLNFKNNGLKYTRFLFVYTDEMFNVFARPIEYKKYQKRIESVETQFNNLMKDTSGLNDSFLFLPFHKFIYLNQPIWQKPNGEKVKLIN